MEKSMDTLQGNTVVKLQARRGTNWRMLVNILKTEYREGQRVRKVETNPLWRCLNNMTFKRELTLENRLLEKNKIIIS